MVNKIENMYLKIPKKFLKKVENPNYELHKINLPFRMCIIAPSGSGKTNFLINLISLFSKNNGTFSSIQIITKNKDEPLYNWLSSIDKSIIITEGINSIPKLDEFDSSNSHIVIIDDLVLSKDLSSIENYYIRARKLNVSVIFISQSFYRIPKIIRQNCSYFAILKLGGNREINMILSEFALGIDKTTLLKLYDYATKEKFQCLFIDLEATEEKRFRKGLNEILDVAADFT
tara:strand:- start:249 stop:941 length:693 start_codon:yes stop_codon:yes gene_type:complete